MVHWNAAAVPDHSGKLVDEEAARRFLEARRWPATPLCPRCGFGERMHRQSRGGVDGYYRCPHCRCVFTVRSGTLLERSHVPLAKWLFAMGLIARSRRPVSSVRLARLLGVTQKTAWTMLQRLRTAADGDAESANAFLRGLVAPPGGEPQSVAEMPAPVDDRDGATVC